RKKHKVIPGQFSHMRRRQAWRRDRPSTTLGNCSYLPVDIRINHVLIHLHMGLAQIIYQIIGCTPATITTLAKISSAPTMAVTRPSTLTKALGGAQIFEDQCLRSMNTVTMFFVCMTQHTTNRTPIRESLIFDEKKFALASSGN